MTTLDSADRVDFFDMVSAYAQKGLADWQRKSANDQLIIRRDVQNYIEEIATTIDTKFALAKTGVDPGFLLIPVPKHTHKKHFEVAFFTPKIKRSKGALEVGFTFLLWKTVTSKGETIGFRFEGPHPNSQHEYPHVQICTEFRAPTALRLTIPSWVPDSYPAMPMLAHSPYDMFFSMVAAIHGHSLDPTKSAMLNVLNDSLQSASKTAMIPNVGARVTAQFQRLVI